MVTLPGETLSSLELSTEAATGTDTSTVLLAFSRQRSNSLILMRPFQNSMEYTEQTYNIRLKVLSNPHPLSEKDSALVSSFKTWDFSTSCPLHSTFHADLCYNSHRSIKSVVHAITYGYICTYMHVHTQGLPSSSFFSTLKSFPGIHPLYIL